MTLERKRTEIELLANLYRGERRESNANVGALRAEPLPGWELQGEARLLSTFAAEKQHLLRRDSRGRGRNDALVSSLSFVRKMGFAAVLAIGLTALFLAFEFPWVLGEPALTFSTDKVGSVRSSGRVTASGHPKELTFSDGSKLSLKPGGSVRVRDTDAFGATIIVERGTVDTAVVHRSKTSFSLLAGPFEVKVTGTRFLTTWVPEEGEFSVNLVEGAVQILGAGIDRAVSLEAGQRFSAHHSGEWSVSPLVNENAHPKSSPAASSEPSASQSKAELDEPTSPPGRLGRVEDRETRDLLPKVTDVGSRERASLPEATTPPWKQLVAEGDFRAVLELAERKGMQTCLASCSAAELRALSDAARYSARTTLARKALLRLREIAPAERARAGYLLGSLAEARGRSSEALTWYRTYISEAQSGALLSEAHAGLLRCLVALGRDEEAQGAARRYLSAYPRGVGAKVARQILERP